MPFGGAKVDPYGDSQAGTCWVSLDEAVALAEAVGLAVPAARACSCVATDWAWAWRLAGSGR